MAWKLNSRCSRSSRNRRRIGGAEPAEGAEPEQPRPTPGRRQQVERGVVVAVDEVGQLRPRRACAASRRSRRRRRRPPTPQVSAISARIASWPCRTWMVLSRRRTPPGRPGRAGARQQRRRGRRRRRASASSTRSGMVSTVGPVSKVNPSSSSRPARPPGMSSRSTTVTSYPRPVRWQAAASPDRPAPMTTTLTRHSLRSGTVGRTVPGYLTTGGKGRRSGVRVRDPAGMQQRLPQTLSRPPGPT